MIGSKVLTGPASQTFVVVTLADRAEFSGGKMFLTSQDLRSASSFRRLNFRILPATFTARGVKPRQPFRVVAVESVTIARPFLDPLLMLLTDRDSDA